MKVAHLTSAHHTFDVRIFHKECKTLAAAGYDVTLIAPREPEDIQIREGVRLRAVPKPGGRRERMTRIVWQVYRAAVAEDAHIYHFHDPELIPIGMLLRLRGKRVVYDVHEDVPKQILTKSWLPSSLKRGFSTSVAVLEYVVGKVFSGIVAATPAIATHFPGSKTITVQNFPVIRELVCTESTPYSQRHPDVAYIGNISERRGFRDMLGAIAALPANLNCRLLLAGRTHSSKLENELLNFHSKNSVTFLGWLDRNGIRELLHKVRIGLVVLHPVSDYVESYPVKMFEYMVAGIPVVASNFPLWREIIEEINCGLLVEPVNPQAIAKAIQWLLEHPQEAEAMGKRGKKAVIEKYNWHKEAEKLTVLYRNILMNDNNEHS